MDHRTLLTGGALEVLGVLPYASNYTFLTRATLGEDETLAVYKPRRGERPLWDFPDGTLANREVAASLVSDMGGFDLVPPTVLREDAPLGAGSVQLFIDHDPDTHFFTLMASRREDFALFAAFDVVVNNADRKSGHVIEDRTGRLWALDHGVTFHEEPKLRTVIWEFAEQPLPADVEVRLRATLRGLEDDAQLRTLLSEGEVAATRTRLEALLDRGHFPSPSGHHPLPWPLV